MGLDYNWSLADSLVFNDSVVNGTAGYVSSYAVVEGMDLLILLVSTQVVLSLLTLAFVILWRDLR